MEDAACERRADPASVWLCLGSGTNCVDYPAAKFWERLTWTVLKFYRLKFYQSTLQLTDFLLVFTSSLPLSWSEWHCLLQRSTCVFMIKEAVRGETRSLLLWRSETRLRRNEEITCKPLRVVKLLPLRRAVSFCQSWSLCILYALSQRFSELPAIHSAREGRVDCDGQICTWRRI